MKRVSVPIPSWPWWLLGGRKEKEPVSNGVSLNASLDALKSPPKKMSFSEGKVRSRWLRKGAQRSDLDYDMVLHSDGVCSPDSEADGPEWSVGWTEPHGPDFQSDDGDGGFLVLVPCYRGVVKGSSNQLLSAIKDLPNGFSPDGKNYMEQWLSLLQNL